MAVPVKRAEYLEQVLPEYRWNPLIEALPDILSSEETMALLRRRARYDEEERQLSAKYRMHCLARLAHEYYQPLPQHFLIESKISVCIRQGYLNRNPMSRGHVLMANEMYAAMRDKRKEYPVPGYRPNASGFTIIGVSGVGKSSAVESILDLYPQVIEHQEYKGKQFRHTQLVYLKLDCPHNGQLGGLCYSFFEEIDKVLGTTYYDEYKRARITIDSMMILMKRIAHEYSLGLLCVDEVQHLSQAKSGSDAMLNFFVTLVNTIGVPVILIGTSKAAQILQGEFRQARRGSGQGDLIWNRMEQNDADWELFVRTMWKYQWTREKIPYSRDMLEMMYHETQGIVVLAVVLYALVQEEAILNETEVFGTEDIQKTAHKRMALVQPMIEAIRSGNQKLIDRYADITTIVLDQFDREHASGSTDMTRTGRTSSGKVMEHLQEEVLPFLLKMGVLPEKAEDYLEQAYREIKKDDVKAVLRRAYALSEADEDIKTVEMEGTDEEQDLRSTEGYPALSEGGMVDREEW